MWWNKKELKSPYRCEYCDQEIRDGEEYIKNSSGEYIHEDCDFDHYWLIEWLGGSRGYIDLEAEKGDLEYDERYR